MVLPLATLNPKVGVYIVPYVYVNMDMDMDMDMNMNMNMIMDTNFTIVKVPYINEYHCTYFYPGHTRQWPSWRDRTTMYSGFSINTSSTISTLLRFLASKSILP